MSESLLQKLADEAEIRSVLDEYCLRLELNSFAQGGLRRLALAFFNARYPFLPWRTELGEVVAIRGKTVLVAYIISGAVGLALLGRSALTDVLLLFWLLWAVYFLERAGRF